MTSNLGKSRRFEVLYSDRPIGTFTQETFCFETEGAWTGIGVDVDGRTAAADAPVINVYAVSSAGAVLLASGTWTGPGPKRVVNVSGQVAQRYRVTITGSVATVPGTPVSVSAVAFGKQPAAQAVAGLSPVGAAGTLPVSNGVGVAWTNQIALGAGGFASFGALPAQVDGFIRTPNDFGVARFPLWTMRNGTNTADVDVLHIESNILILGNSTSNGRLRGASASGLEAVSSGSQFYIQSDTSAWFYNVSELRMHNASVKFTTSDGLHESIRIEDTNNVSFCGGAGSYGSGAGVAFLRDATTLPTGVPAGGELVWSDPSWGLRRRSRNGVTTTIAPVGAGTANTQSRTHDRLEAVVRTADGAAHAFATIAIPNNSQAVFSLRVSARCVTAGGGVAVGDAAMRLASVLVKNVAGVVTAQAVQAEASSGDASLAGVAVTATAAGGTLLLNVTGINLAALDWQCFVDAYWN